MYNLGLFLLYFIMSSGEVSLTEAESEWIYLAEIMRDQTECIQDPVVKLQRMTEWLHVNVKHIPGGRYPRSFNRKSIATVIQSGMGNCGYQSSNIVGFSQLLGYHQHRVLHHKKNMGAPGDHAFAEIKINDRWIIYDPDNFLYFSNDQGNLIGVDEVASDTTSWIGISVLNKAYHERRSAKNIPQTRFNYSYYEKSGLAYIRLLKKMIPEDPKSKKTAKPKGAITKN